MRVMVFSGQRSGGRSWGAGRMCPPWPVALVLAPPVALGLGVAAIVVILVGLAVVLTLAAVAFSVALAAGIFAALGFVAWQIARHSVPALAGARGPRKSGRPDGWSEDTSRGRLGGTPVDVLRRRYAAGEIGQTAFRQRLTELLKERYVRGDLTLAEFENRVRQLYQDPALRPPAA